MSETGLQTKASTTITKRISTTLASRRRALKWMSVGALGVGVGLANAGPASADDCENTPWCCGSCGNTCPGGCYRNWYRWYCSWGCQIRCTICTCPSSWYPPYGWCHCGWRRTSYLCSPYNSPCQCP